MDGVELCAFINRMLTKACEVEPSDVVGGARDSCSTNGTAMRNLKLVMLNLQDFLCVSHTLSKLGEHIDLPTLGGFMTHWLGLVQHHPSAKTLWMELTGGSAMKGYSTIRWCSREEVQNELAAKLGTHVSSFVDKLIERDIGEAHPRKMKVILDSQLETLQNELALSLDMERIIKAVYKLEADTLVVLLAYDEIDTLLTFGDTIGDTPYSLPNLAALLRGKITIQNNVKVYEYFANIGWFEGRSQRFLPPPPPTPSILSSTPTASLLCSPRQRCASGSTCVTFLSGGAWSPRPRRAFTTCAPGSMGRATTSTTIAQR
eukprot:2130345-Prymnesium_polylepis.1